MALFNEIELKRTVMHSVWATKYNLKEYKYYLSYNELSSVLTDLHNLIEDIEYYIDTRDETLYLDEKESNFE